MTEQRWPRPYTDGRRGQALVRWVPSAQPFEINNCTRPENAVRQSMSDIAIYHTKSADGNETSNAPDASSMWRGEEHQSCPQVPTRPCDGN